MERYTHNRITSTAVTYACKPPHHPHLSRAETFFARHAEASFPSTAAAAATSLGLTAVPAAPSTASKPHSSASSGRSISCPCCCCCCWRACWLSGGVEEEECAGDAALPTPQAVVVRSGRSDPFTCGRGGGVRLPKFGQKMMIRLSHTWTWVWRVNPCWAALRARLMASLIKQKQPSVGNMTKSPSILKRNLIRINPHLPTPSSPHDPHTSHTCPHLARHTILTPRGRVAESSELSHQKGVIGREPEGGRRSILGGGGSGAMGRGEGSCQEDESRGALDGPAAAAVGDDIDGTPLLED